MKKWLAGILILFSLSTTAQTGSDIILFDLKMENGQVVLSNPTNITNHKGYDNQPSFHPAMPIIYYSSFDDSSRSDIKTYNYKTGKTSNLTTTREREYSPTVTPDGKFISCIIQRDNGAQDLGKYPINGGKPIVLINDLKVGYHAWASKNQLLLYVLGDSSTNSLHFYNLDTKKDTIVSRKIGRSLHKIPGQNAMSFLEGVSSEFWQIKSLDVKTLTADDIVYSLRGQGDITWLKNNIIITSDGKELYFARIGTDKQWKLVSLQGVGVLFKGITRLATNADNTKLAVVISE